MASPQMGFVWALWFILFVGWVLVLSGLSALQANCGSSGINLVGVGVAYLTNTGCGLFYRFSWWICWYLFAITLLIAFFAAGRAFHIFRAGLLGLSAPLLVLLMDTCNTYFYYNALPLDGTTKARSRVTLAGSIIATIALFTLIMVIGVFDEEKGKAARRGGTGEPKGQTYGGVYQPGPEERGTAEAATYSAPTRE